MPHSAAIHYSARERVPSWSLHVAKLSYEYGNYQLANHSAKQNVGKGGLWTFSLELHNTLCVVCAWTTGGWPNFVGPVDTHYPFPCGYVHARFNVCVLRSNQGHIKSS